jgi:predicted nuclease of predicted toxin-antitoxin system
LTDVRFYFGENIPSAVAEQLEMSGIEVFTAKSLDLLGKRDLIQLNRAIELKCALCTHDADFIQIAQSVSEHFGIVWAAHQDASIGGWVKRLRELHARETQESMKGQFRYLSLK